MHRGYGSQGVAGVLDVSTQCWSTGRSNPSIPEISGLLDSVIEQFEMPALLRAWPGCSATDQKEVIGFGRKQGQVMQFLLRPQCP